MTPNTEHVTSTNQSSTQYIAYELECPFAWETQSYFHSRTLLIFPYGMDPTLSFTVTRKSKVLGYIPLIGTAIGVYRIFMGIREYLFFKAGPLDSLSKRSLIWITRGAIELIPVLGGLVCMIIDFIATSRYDSTQNSLIIEDNDSRSDVETSVTRITANDRAPTIFIQNTKGKSYPSVLSKIDPTDLSTACKIFTLSTEQAKKLEVIEKRYVFLIENLKKTQSRLSAYMKQELQIQIDYVHAVHPTLVAYASSFPQNNLNDRAELIPYEIEEIDD